MVRQRNFSPPLGGLNGPGAPGLLDIGQRDMGALASCKELTTLDEYLELRGVKGPHDLPRKTR